MADNNRMAGRLNSRLHTIVMRTDPDNIVEALNRLFKEFPLENPLEEDIEFPEGWDRIPAWRGKSQIDFFQDFNPAATFREALAYLAAGACVGPPPN